MMNRGRRALLVGGAAWVAARSGAAEVWGEPPTPAAGDVGAPIWPPAERFSPWPGAAPGQPDKLPAPSSTMNGPQGDRQLWISGISKPEVHVFRAARPNGTALLVFPGGGYSFLAVQNEGIDAARRFTPLGFSVFVLTYRLPGEGWAKRDRVPLQDAQRAIRLLRARATTYAINAEQIGILGFSAGGHLACDLVTAFDESCYAPVDAADRLTARPRFAGLVYPVASLRDGVAHVGSRERLLGNDPSPALIARRSPTEHVRADTPPCFIVHSIDDEAVPVDASTQMLGACRRAKVPVEAHLFESGGHGFGFHSAADLPVSRWPDLFSTWIARH